MGSLDDNGIYIYDENDRPAPLHTVLNLGQASVSAAVAELASHALVKPVANVAGRDAYEQDMRDAGYVPSPQTPLYVDVADSGSIQRHRGAGWEQIYSPSIETISPSTSSTAWEYRNRLFIRNGYVTAKVRAKRTGPPWHSQTVNMWGAQPSHVRPPEQLVSMAFIHLRQDVYRTALFVIGSDGSGSLLGASINTGNWVNATITWPAGGDA